MKMNKIIIILTAVLFAFSCTNPNVKSHNTTNVESEEHNHTPEGTVALNENQIKALDLKLGKMQKRNLTTVIKANGKLEVSPENTADVTVFIGGNVKRIKVFHGDKVRKGQVLAILEHPDYVSLQEEYAKTIHELEFLKLDYERQKELVENNVGAGRNLQKVKSDYQIAKAKLQGLKSRLQLLNISTEDVKNGIIRNSIAIISPIKGYVNDVNVKIGTYVDAKDKLFEITDNSSIHADFMIFEKDVQYIKEGQKIHFSVANRPEEEFLATIFAIGKEFEPSNRAVHIHAKLDKKPTGLIPGMYISGHIHTDKILTNTLPNDAIVTEGTKSYVFVLQENYNHEEEHLDEGNHENHDEDHPSDSYEDYDEKGVKMFKMVEIIKGQQDEGYTEVKMIKALPEDTQFVLNAAYYLIADMKKEETEHEH